MAKTQTDTPEVTPEVTYALNGSDYFGSDGLLYKGQTTPPQKNENGDEVGICLEPNPVNPEPYQPKYTYNAVIKTTRVDQQIPGKQQFVRAQDFPTGATVAAIQAIIAEAFPGMAQAVTGNTTNPILETEKVQLVLSSQVGECVVDPGQLAFMQQCHDTQRVVSDVRSALLEKGMVA